MIPDCCRRSWILCRSSGLPGSQTWTDRRGRLRPSETTPRLAAGLAADSPKTPVGFLGWVEKILTAGRWIARRISAGFDGPPMLVGAVTSRRSATPTFSLTTVSPRLRGDVMTVLRRVFAVLAWAYLAAVVVQVFLAGLGLPQLGGQGMEMHAGFGYVAVHMTPILLILFAAISRAGKAVIWWTVATAVVAFLQPIWVTSFQGEALASIHVLGALALLGSSFQVARLATVRLRSQPAT